MTFFKRWRAGTASHEGCLQCRSDRADARSAHRARDGLLGQDGPFQDLPVLRSDANEDAENANASCFNDGLQHVAFTSCIPSMLRGIQSNELAVLPSCTASYVRIRALQPPFEIKNATSVEAHQLESVHRKCQMNAHVTIRTSPWIGMRERIRYYHRSASSSSTRNMPAFLSRLKCWATSPQRLSEPNILLLRTPHRGLPSKS